MQPPARPSRRSWASRWPSVMPMSFLGSAKPAVISRGEGRHLDVLGEIITLVVSGEDTNGSFAVLTERSPPGGGTPFHTHHNEDEALYVLEGEYEILCGEETVRATAGSFVFAPRGIPHRFTNVGSTTGAILAIVSPAGFEGFFEEVSALPAPTDRSAVAAIATKYELDIHPG
jgi:quercetin dioxygenase-like cupin family protein